MADGIEGWRHLDAETGAETDIPDPSILPNQGKGRVVVLATTPGARSGGWASKVVVSLAGHWAGSGLRVFLMDLGLDSPSLHLALDLPNDEGVSDAFLYGASVQRIAQPALDEAIFFAPAGTQAADPEEILGHSRWDDLAGGFSEADATLLLFLPTDIAGAESILNRATDILFLATRDESPDTHLGPAAVKVVSSFGPLEVSEVASEEPAESEEGEVEGEGTAEEEGTTLDLEESISLAEGFEPPVADPDSLAEEPEGTEAAIEGVETEAEGLEAEAVGAETEVEGLEVEAGGVEAEMVGIDPVEVDSQEPDTVLGSGEGTPEEDLPQEESPEAVEDEPEKMDGLVPEGTSGMMEGLELGSQFAAAPDDGPGPEGPGDMAQSRTAPEVPDFGAEFADLPSLEEEEVPEMEVGGGEGFAHRDDSGTPEETGESPPPGAPPAHPGPATSAEEPARSTPGADPSRPKPRRRPPPKRRLPMGLLVGLLVVLTIVLAAVGTATGIVSIPGFRFLEDMFGEIEDPALTLEGSPQANEPVIRFSLELFTYEEDELTWAVDMRDQLSQEMPGLLFTVIPRESDGVVSYAVLAGPALTAIDIENLRGVLGEKLTRIDPDSWPRLETPRAFYLGERPTLEEAQEFLASVEAEGIWAYVLHVTYPNGEEAYEVLSGAFAGVLDARPLQLLLRRTDFRDAPLIERRGRLPE